MQAIQRVQKEFKEISEEVSSGVAATLVNDDLSHWHGVIHGPDDSPYMGGTFHVDILIPVLLPILTIVAFIRLCLSIAQVPIALFLSHWLYFHVHV